MKRIVLLKKTEPAGKYALILVAIFMLSKIVLPPEYRAFVPFLFLIPLIPVVIQKARQACKKNEYSPLCHPDADHTVEPYSYTPKDPNDPRRYKPIG